MPVKSLKTPPVPVVRAVERVRAGLEKLHRSLVPGNIALLETVTGAWTTQMLYVAAKLGIPDQLSEGPLHAAEVAERIQADPDAVYRLMRGLASKGVLKHRRDDRFALAPVGDALRADSPASMRALVLFFGHTARWEDWGQLLHSVQSGQPAALKLRGMPYFDYLDTDPELADAFNDAMTATSSLTTYASLSAYDFTRFRRIVDVGGGHGALLSMILRRAPQAQGVLYDLPSVVEGAETTLKAAGVADRCSREGGSFMESVPAGADAYVLKTVIHDWDDDTSLQILRNVRAAIGPDGKLLLFEFVIPDRAKPHFGMLLDLEMLITVGGRERTRDEYAKLLSGAGFRLDRVIETVTPLSIVEASPG